MTTPYEPTSDFLTAIVSGDVRLAGDEFADTNLQRLIDLTRDDDLSNRDWATMLLAQEEADTISIRSALCAARMTKMILSGPRRFADLRGERQPWLSPL
jgi:hypothetical protein